ncbi:uncharacterized protein LOC110041277 [Orbicella faveolata]|uniref:uncharacterized protein LOC110041277 n=1 Tax=Orbicella faveolata TaxID=48498 RepID=UPI0009E52A37|nr:uncharacterized protein LOC110041277 [Orbicella faveolata]
MARTMSYKAVAYQIGVAITKTKTEVNLRDIKENITNSNAACKLPVLDPFHSSVIHFMKDLGKLRCSGVSYSSFENNVLRVEGEGVVSVQYRKIERTPRNDFGVVLSDPVNVQSTGGSRVAAKIPKDLYNNLVHNSRVLTSPFDVYATLRHILSYPQYPSEIITGQSLFTRIDERNRTCASAGVEDHWCPCLDLEPVSIDEPAVKKSAAAVLEYINNLTSQGDELSKLCQRLILKEIKTAFREMPKEAMQRFQDTKHGTTDACDNCEIVLGDKAENTLVRDTLYQLQILTSPNEGFYEASVKMNNGVPSIVGDLSRIDAYKDQPYCIMETYPLLRKFCYCSPKSFAQKQ